MTAYKRTDDIKIRLLSPEEWAIYKEMRLHSLKTESRVFSRTWEEEAGLPDEAWRNDLCNDKEGYFGLFDGDKMVGLTAVFPDKADPSGKTAKLGLSYILPAYRGLGLSQKLYEARIGWVLDHPVYEHIKVSHKLSNEVSRRANQHFGFAYTHTVPAVKWPDGSVEDEVFYKLETDELRRAARATLVPVPS